MNRRWTIEEANAWFDSYPWLRGCNFIGSDCASRIDMWQSYKSEEHLATADRELARAKEIGFNTVRLLIEFDVWLQERASFMDILEKYIALCNKHGQYVMLCLANEAVLPRGNEFVPKPLGEQFYALGFHQGRLPLTEEQKALPAFHPLEKPEWKEKYLEMVTEVVTRYAKDPRVIVWNVYNEPGIVLGDRCIPLLEMLFKTVRACDPVQPLTSDVWHWREFKDGKPTTNIGKFGLENSDVISYHSYQPLVKMVPIIEALKSFGRPVLMTEWLNRIARSDVKDIYPLFYLERIACWCWGFVVGKTQTHEPWDTLWEQYERGDGDHYDFTKWQHDLFRPNLRPYDPHELEVIKMYNELADKRYEREKQSTK